MVSRVETVETVERFSTIEARFGSLREPCACLEPARGWPGARRRCKEGREPGTADRPLGVLTRMDTELFHTRKQGCAVDAHAGGSSIGAAHPALALYQCSHNLFPPLVGVLV